MKTKVVVWGAGGHSLVVADILRLTGHDVAGFLDDQHPEREGEQRFGARVFGSVEALGQLLREGVTHAFVGIGNCSVRLGLAERLLAQGFRLATAIHPRSIVAGDVPVGAGTMVAGGAVVNPGARLGANVIVNTGAIIDHECVLEDGAHVCPGARLAGNVTVGRAAWVGIGSTVKERVAIGAGAFLGAGSVVLKDIAEGAVAYGVPAIVRRTGPVAPSSRLAS